MSELKVNVISEVTGANGVVVDSVKLKDGGIVIADAGNIGSVSDVDAIAIGSDGDITLTQDLELQHDGAILSFGANDEVSLTHVHDTGLLLNSTNVIQFNDASQNIGAPSATVLDINATDEIELNATLVDINANVEISGTATTTGVHTFTAVPVFPNNTIETADIQADAVTGAKIADDANNSEHYTDGSIDTAHIADGQVTVGKLATAVLTGATDIGAAIADADLFLVDDGAGGTLRKTAASRLKTYVVPGLTGFDSWRLTSNFTGSSGTIDGSWERQDTASENIKLGTGMSESSGVFTFPNTGIWKIEFWTNVVPAAASNYTGFYVSYSTNGGTGYSYLNGAWGSTDTSGRSITIGASNFLNVSNATNYRIKAIASATGNGEYQANTNVNYTYFNFIRLGDST